MRVSGISRMGGGTVEIGGGWLSTTSKSFAYPTVPRQNLSISFYIQTHPGFCFPYRGVNLPTCNLDILI